DDALFDGQVAASVDSPSPKDGFVPVNNILDQRQTLRVGRNGSAVNCPQAIAQLQPLNGDVEGRCPGDVEDARRAVAVHRDLGGAGAGQNEIVCDGDLAIHLVEQDGPLQAGLEDDGIGARVRVGGVDPLAQGAGGAVVPEVGDGERGRHAAVFQHLQL